MTPTIITPILDWLDIAGIADAGGAGLAVSAVLANAKAPAYGVCRQCLLR